MSPSTLTAWWLVACPISWLVGGVLGRFLGNKFANAIWRLMNPKDDR